MTLFDESSQELKQVPRETWPAVKHLPQLTGPTIPIIASHLYVASPSTILKLNDEEGETIMTALAHSIVGPSVPHIDRIITVLPFKPDLPPQRGFVMSRQPGTPLVELWPSLTPSQRRKIKEELCQILVGMRTHRFSYYGRPGRRPYLFFSAYGTEEYYDFCTSRLEWDDSRIRALHAASEPIDAERAAGLVKVQRETDGMAGWDRPVLTHADLSERNILVDPNTFAVTGFLDWERSNILPAYFEYVYARLSGGHEPGWRVEILDVLRSVLRRECDAASVSDAEAMYKKTLAAWDAVLDVERLAQNYNDKCYWTFETGLPASEKTDSAL